MGVIDDDLKCLALFDFLHPAFCAGKIGKNFGYGLKFHIICQTHAKGGQFIVDIKLPYRFRFYVQNIFAVIYPVLYFLALRLM